jgi:hypothetical protein
MVLHWVDLAIVMILDAQNDFHDFRKTVRGEQTMRDVKGRARLIVQGRNVQKDLRRPMLCQQIMSAGTTT